MAASTLPVHSWMNMPSQSSTSRLRLATRHARRASVMMRLPRPSRAAVAAATVSGVRRSAPRCLLWRGPYSHANTAVSQACSCSSLTEGKPTRLTGTLR